MDKSSSNNLYVFVLGREREIALEELKAVLHRFGFCFDITSVSGNTAVVNIDNVLDSDVAKLISVLGGTVKIFKLIPPLAPPILGGGKEGAARDDDLVGSIIEIIAEYRTDAGGKLNFGISDYTGKIDTQKVNNIGIEVKMELKKKGYHPRFVALREGNGLSSIVSLKNNLDGKGIEIGIFSLNQYCSSDGALESRTARGFSTSSKNILYGILLAVTDAEEWSKRDYGKPAGDKYSGMTPPKLARMMVNIALSLIPPLSKGRLGGVCFKNEDHTAPNPSYPRRGNRSCLVLDPFCGSGNILLEALMLGCNVVGSDVSGKAVADSKKNVEWLLGEMTKSKYKIPNKIQIPKFQILKADATKEDFTKLLDCHFDTIQSAGGEKSSALSDINKKISPLRGRMGRDDIIIVTELYLGQPKKFKPTLNAAKGEYEKIKKLYLGFLKNLALSHFHTFTPCLVFPLVETIEGKRYSLHQNSLDDIGKLGYTEVRPSLIYGRDYQVVKREIVFLKEVNGS